MIMLINEMAWFPPPINIGSWKRIASYSSIKLFRTKDRK